MNESLIPYLFAWSLASISIAIIFSIYLTKYTAPKERRIIGPILQKLNLRSKEHGGAKFLGYCHVYYLDDEGEIHRRVVVKHPQAVLADSIEDMTEKTPKKISDFYN